VENVQGVRLFDVSFHVSAAKFAAEITTDLYRCNSVDCVAGPDEAQSVVFQRCLNVTPLDNKQGLYATGVRLLVRQGHTSSGTVWRTHLSLEHTDERLL